MTQALKQAARHVEKLSQGSGDGAAASSSSSSSSAAAAGGGAVVRAYAGRLEEELRMIARVEARANKHMGCAHAHTHPGFPHWR